VRNTDRVIWAGVASLAILAGGPAPADVVPRYDHIFVIIEENRSYSKLMAGPESPNLQALAKTYGVASNAYGVVHPSEGNYVALVGGSTFGIHDDDGFGCKPASADRWCPHSGTDGYPDHTVTSRSIVDQIEEKGLTWKGYFEDIPEPGSLAIRWPDPQSPIPGKPVGLYAVKHNGFMTFARVQNDPKRAEKIVGFDQLTKDLAAGTVPNYAHIVPNQCNDMHGIDEGTVPPDCTKDNEAGLIARGDAELGRLVKEIEAASFWNGPGNNAIVVTFDEDGKPRNPADPQGCCGYEPGSKANFGGGHIPFVVITNHGPRGIVDPTPYNHYSLLRTTEDAFGITEHLNLADAAGVVPMSTLFEVAP
jgi:hypothetical protein